MRLVQQTQMRARSVLLGCCVTLLGASARGETAAQAEVAKCVRAAFAAMNRGDMAAVSAFYGPSAVIVDDMAPYVWTPPNAFGNWVKAEAAWMASNAVNGVTCDLEEVVRNEVSDSFAYFVGRGGCVVIKAKGPTYQAGTWTMVMHRAPQGWRAAYMVFGGEALHPR